MKKVLKLLISTLLIIAIIFTTGINLIEESNDTTELQEKKVKEEKNLEQKIEKDIKEDNENKSEEKVETSEPEKEDPEEVIEEKQENGEAEKKEEKPADKKDIKSEESNKETKEDEGKGKEEKLDKEPLNIKLNDAETLIEDSIRLGSSKDPQEDNYMSEAIGGSGNYTYEWRIKGSDKVFSKEKNPTVNPDDDTHYELTLKDSDGDSLTVGMVLRVLDPKGSITIKARAVNSKNQKFDIFVSGPNGSLYTVRVRSGESVTINNLKRGDYLVYTIVPMNYKLSNIINNNMNLSVGGLDKEVTVNYERTNTSWFYSR